MEGLVNGEGEAQPDKKTATIHVAAQTPGHGARASEPIAAIGGHAAHG